MVFFAASLNKPLPDVYLICREGCLNGELECEGEDAEGKYTKEEAGCYDVLRHVGDEEEVGEHENADNWAEAAEFCDLHHLASLLGRDAEHDGPEGPGEDDEGAAQSSQLVAVPNTGSKIFVISEGIFFSVYQKIRVNFNTYYLRKIFNLWIL